MLKRRYPSPLWFLLPIFLGIIGGLIGYFVFRKKDRQSAHVLLMMGVVVMVISIVAGSFLLGSVIK